MAEELPRLVAFRDEPVAEPTDVALYRISRLAAQSVKVVLAGEGGDELFAGYPKYAADRLAGLVSAFPQEVTHAIVRWLPYRQRRVKLALEALSIRDEAERSATWFASFSREEREALFSPDFLAQVDVAHPARVFEQYLEKVRDRSPLKRMLYADLKIWLPDNLLLRGDQMTMAASIEERVPFLDHKLVELAARIPSRLLTRGFRTKVLLRQRAARRTCRRKRCGGARWDSPCPSARGSGNRSSRLSPTWCSHPRRDRADISIAKLWSSSCANTSTASATGRSSSGRW